MKYKDWNIEAITGYKPITTFYMDFSIADSFGIKAIEGTHKNAMAYAKTDYKVLTELVMALNWKIWEHNEVNETYAELYTKLYNSTANYATSTLKDEELSYYYRTTD